MSFQDKYSQQWKVKKSVKKTFTPLNKIPVFKEQLYIFNINFYIWYTDQPQIYSARDSAHPAVEIKICFLYSASPL